jgi:hypothetical protein
LTAIARDFASAVKKAFFTAALQAFSFAVAANALLAIIVAARAAKAATRTSFKTLGETRWAMFLPL